MSAKCLHIAVPRGVDCRVDTNWGQTHIYISVGDDFEGKSVGSALFAMAVQAMREESLRKSEDAA